MAMHLAARNGHEQVMLVLHKHGCAIDGPGEGDRTPACEAALNGHTMTLQAMKDKMGADLCAGEGYETCNYKPAVWHRSLKQCSSWLGAVAISTRSPKVYKVELPCIVQ